MNAKEYRGREYPQFWLSFQGLFLALINRANRDILKQTQEKLHGKNEEIDLVFELARILPAAELKMLYNACEFSKDNLQINIPIPMKPKKAKIWRKALRKSPKYQKITREILKQALEELESLKK